MNVSINIDKIYLWLKGASEALNKNMNYINSINVFPVADGDTGRNMYRTIHDSLLSFENNSDTLLDEVSVALLVHARGNSGVITSQIIRSILSYLNEKEELGSHDFQNMFRLAEKNAYDCIAHPIEGTILSICRAAAKVETKDSINEYLMEVSTAIHLALEKTTSQLNVLAEFGVVDSGGQGLVIIYDKLIDVVLGIHREPYIIYNEITQNKSRQNGTPGYKSVHKKYEYEIMFMCDCDINIILNMKNSISHTSTSITVGSESEKHSFHLHTDSPGQVIEIIYKHVLPYNLNIHKI